MTNYVLYTRNDCLYTARERGGGVLDVSQSINLAPLPLFSNSK